MKWFWLSGYNPRVDLYLLHEYERATDRRLLLPRFAKVDRCRGCEKFNEQQLLEVGFDLERVFRMPQDILTGPNDISQTIVTERFRDVCIDNNITGIDFIPCGRRKPGDRLYLMWAVHRSPCHDPVEKWLRGGTPLKPGDPPYQTCDGCGRPEQVIGFPRQSSLELPDELTISITSIRTEMRDGMDFRFFCSDTVRQIFKAAKLKGCDFSDMVQREKFYESIMKKKGS